MDIHNFVISLGIASYKNPAPYQSSDLSERTWIRDYMRCYSMVPMSYHCSRAI